MGKGPARGRSPTPRRYGAGRGNRTPTPLRAPDFESPPQTKSTEQLRSSSVTIWVVSGAHVAHSRPFSGVPSDSTGKVRAKSPRPLPLARSIVVGRPRPTSCVPEEIEQGPQDLVSGPGEILNHDVGYDQRVSVERDSLWAKRVSAGADLHSCDPRQAQAHDQRGLDAEVSPAPLVTGESVDRASST
jgi:hypothetical protein